MSAPPQIALLPSLAPGISCTGIQWQPKKTYLPVEEAVEDGHHQSLPERAGLVQGLSICLGQQGLDEFL